MRQFISSLFDKFKKRPMKILMVWLDGAGKTTILYKLRLGEFIQTIPTIGFNVERNESKNISFTVWDVSGHPHLRKINLWCPHYENAQAIILVVDSSDTERLDQAAANLNLLLSEPLLEQAPLMVFANKQDIALMYTNQIQEILGLDNASGLFFQSSKEINSMRFFLVRI